VSPVGRQRPQDLLSNDDRRILERSERFILYSITEDGNTNRKANFHGYRILKRLPVENSNLKARLVAALYRGISDNAWQKACFDPGLGLRAVRKGKKVDLLICFGCSWIVVIAHGNEVSGSISTSPQSLFQSVLTGMHPKLRD